MSALIFVALAVAWGVYLVPKALRHHEEDADSRSVEGFSDRLRVLARREAVSAKETELVPAGRSSERTTAPTPAPRAAELESDIDVDVSAEGSASPARGAARAAALAPAEAERRARRARAAAARRAAQRRRRVFQVLLAAVVVVAALGIGKVISLAWTTGPLLLMGAWLVLCRVMVTSERAQRAAADRRGASALTSTEEQAASVDEVEDVAAEELTDEIPAVVAEEAESVTADEGWAPVRVPLPTYVAKAPAGRTVRTIDLDSTGVWSSGRKDADSQLAREAEAERSRTEAEAEAERHRATGS